MSAYENIKRDPRGLCSHTWHVLMAVSLLFMLLSVGVVWVALRLSGIPEFLLGVLGGIWFFESLAMFIGGARLDYHGHVTSECHE